MDRLDDQFLPAAPDGAHRHHAADLAGRAAKLFFRKTPQRSMKALHSDVMLAK